MIDSPKSLTEQMLNFTERVASEMRAIYNKIGNPVRKVNNVEPDSNGDVTIAVPTKVSELQNDSGFITSAPVASVNGFTEAVTLYSCGTADLTAGTSALETGKLYFVYE